MRVSSLFSGGPGEMPRPRPWVRQTLSGPSAEGPAARGGEPPLQELGGQASPWSAQPALPPPPRAGCEAGRVSPRAACRCPD